METLAMKKTLGILMLSMLGACSGGADEGSEREADNGGFDGGGQIALGLSWDKGVFVQPVWDEGQLRLLIANHRTEAVTLGVFETEWSDDPNPMFADEAPTRGASIAQSTINAQSTVSIDASALMGPAGELLWVNAGDERLGLIERPQPPLVTATLPIVNRETFGNAQLETAFALLPGPTFEATVTLTKPGELWLGPPASPSVYVELLTATEASSDDALVTPTTDGFRVVLPDDTSEQKPARVQLSFAVPQGLLSGETMLALDAGYLCTELLGGADCGTGAGIVRLLPAP
jgi:hypothetical protein